MNIITKDGCSLFIKRENLPLILLEGDDERSRLKSGARSHPQSEWAPGAISGASPRGGSTRGRGENSQSGEKSVYLVPYSFNEICAFIVSLNNECLSETSFREIKDYFCSLFPKTDCPSLLSVEDSIISKSNVISKSATKEEKISLQLDNLEVFEEYSSPIQFNIVKNLNRPDYPGIKIKKPEIVVPSPYIADNESFNADIIIEEILKDIFDISLKNLYNIFLYGINALALYNKESFDNRRDTTTLKFHIFKVHPIRNIILECVGKIYEYLKDRKGFSYNNTNIDKVLLVKSHNKIYINIQLRYIFFMGNSVYSRKYNITLEFDTFSCINLQDFYSDMIDCYCIGWDGSNWSMNDRFIRSQQLKSVIYIHGSKRIRDCYIDDLRECLYKGDYCVLIPGLNIEKFKSGISAPKMLRDVEEVAYKMLDFKEEDMCYNDFQYLYRNIFGKYKSSFESSDQSESIIDYIISDTFQGLLEKSKMAFRLQDVKYDNIYTSIF